MAVIKIISDPYRRSIEFFVLKAENWVNISTDNPDSRLREINRDKAFLPFEIKHIIDIIIDEYYTGDGKISLVFEGTPDELEEVVSVCSEDTAADKIELSMSDRYLENARDILGQTKDLFGVVSPVITRIAGDEPEIRKGLEKVSDALDDIIPVCIFGNYSAGKSTFINSLIGYEIMPSGGDPVTAKIFEIKQSKEPEKARICFTCRDVPFELVFKGAQMSLVEGDLDADIFIEIKGALAKIEEPALFRSVGRALEIINLYEKRDRNVVEIGSVVHMEVPFYEGGVLGASKNEFVIFDTPGSNSNSNIDHNQVLKDSLEGFSNGIPVWVTQYDSIDSVDNAKLVDMLSEIDALDKRFTMIVVNKADSVELPKKGFTEEDVTNIMEFESVEQMYSSGIYFVSAVMGLGSKNFDGFKSEYLMDVFDEKERKFSDPKARSYLRLYDYNIMPEQRKQRVVAYSGDFENLIYANSGLYCIENEIDQFATRFSAYNKCQMFYLFLGSAIEETDKRIEDKTAMLEKKKAQWETELDSKSRALISDLRHTSANLAAKYTRESKTYLMSFAKNDLKYEHTADELRSSYEQIDDMHREKEEVDYYQSDFEQTRSLVFNNLRNNVRNIFKGGSLKDVADELRLGLDISKQKMDVTKAAESKADSAGSDDMMDAVVNEYKLNISEARERLIKEAREKWSKNEQDFRECMIRLITESDQVNDEQTRELSGMIHDYAAIDYSDDARDRFLKEKFLLGNVFGLGLGLRERLDTGYLAREYNRQIRRSITEMAEMIDADYSKIYAQWQEQLITQIEANISTYNPQLRELTSFIRDETNRIASLRADQKTISTTYATINSMISWSGVKPAEENEE